MCKLGSRIPAAILRTALLLIALAGIVPLSSCLNCMQGMSGQGCGPVEWRGARFEIRPLAVSPDGRHVVFSYRDHDKNQSGLGITDWQTSEVRRITGGEAGLSFALDGKHLRFLRKHDVIDLDLETAQERRIGSIDDQLIRNPAFQPGEDKVIYTGSSYPSDIRLADLRTGTTTLILEKSKGFYAIFQPAFIGPDEIVFVGMGPHDPAVKEEAASLTSNPHIGALIYRLKFGGQPWPAFPEIAKRERAIDPLTLGVLSLAASRAGEGLFFIGKSKNRDQNSDVFVFRDGRIRQLTNLGLNLETLATSYEGTVVAFVNSTVSRENDLFVLNVQSGAVKQLGLQQRLSNHPDFSAP